MEHKIYENEQIRNMYTALGVTVGTVDDAKQLILHDRPYLFLVRFRHSFLP
jgi:DNA gyrase subunit B